MRTSEAAGSPSRKDVAARRALGEQRATATVQQDSALKGSEGGAAGPCSRIARGMRGAGQCIVDSAAAG